MQSFEIVIPQELLILNIEVNLVSGLPHLEKEKLFLIGAERTLDDGVLIGTRLVNVMVRELHFFSNERVESLLKFQTVVRLNEIALERELRYEELHRLDRERLVKVRKDDTLLVSRIYIHDCVQKQRVGKP